MLEDFKDMSDNLLVQYEQLMAVLSRKDLAADIDGSQAMLRQHSQLRDSIDCADFEQLMHNAHHILRRLEHSRSVSRSRICKYIP